MSAAISSCSDCTIVISAVAGVVLVSNCERLQITLACAKLVLRNCLDCDVKVATLSPSVVSGDSRGLTFSKLCLEHELFGLIISYRCFASGPFNASFRHLSLHLQLARLTPLLSLSNNHWTNICDVTACIDSTATTLSPTGYALDMAGSPDVEGVSLPTPADSTASLLAPEKFFFISVPLPHEHLPTTVSTVCYTLSECRRYFSVLIAIRSISLYYALLYRLILYLSLHN